MFSNSGVVINLPFEICFNFKTEILTFLSVGVKRIMFFLGMENVGHDPDCMIKKAFC